MYIDHESKYQVGQKLYYLSKDKIQEAEIVGIRASFAEGPYYNGSAKFEEFYRINDNRNSYLTEKDLEERFFMSKKDLLKHIVDQI